MYTLDTNAVIYYLKAEREAGPKVRHLLKNEKPIYVSTITEVELFGYSKITPEEIREIKQLLETVTIVPLDSQLAYLAGNIRRLWNLKTPDSIIAATALATGSSLVTRNIKDFRKIPELNIIRI